MPFGPYRNFDDCVQSVSHKKHPPSDPDAYCAWIRRKVEGGGDKFFLKVLADPYACYAYYRLETMLMPSLSVDLFTKEGAQQALAGKDVWKDEPNAVVNDDHRWIHVWADALKRGKTLFIGIKELEKLHKLVLAEMIKRGFESGKKHETPLTATMLLSGGKIEQFLRTRKAFLVDSEFINVVGSSVTGKISDLDVMMKTLDKRYAANMRDTLPPELKNEVDMILEPSGPNGLYIPAYELWAIPTKEMAIKEPMYHINPMSPLPPAKPLYEIGDPHELFEDSYYVVKPEGIRCMIHRRERSVIGFDEKMAEVKLPEKVSAALLAVPDPPTFILDGFLLDNSYEILDMPWWRDSEHISQNAEQRRYFFTKFTISDGLELAHVKYFGNRKDTIDYLKDEDGPCLAIPGLSPYPVDGKASWYLYTKNATLKLAEAADAKIKALIDSGKWDQLGGNERFALMAKRTSVEPLYPFAQLKTSKKGYAEKEIFGLKSVQSLAQELFKVPSKQAVEVKLDGFRTQIHRLEGAVKIFTESGEDITEHLPGIVADVKRLPFKSVIVDSEGTPYDEKMQNLGRPGAVHAFTSKAKGAVDDSRWAFHVFDVLYLDGRATFDLPYEERRKILHGIELPIRDVPKSDADFREHLWENTVNWATTPESMLSFSKTVTDVPGSEGAMYKDASSKYRLSGSTPLWSKMKAQYTLDVLVVGDVKSGNTHNYIGAIGPVEGATEETADAPLESPNVSYARFKGNTYAVLGKSFNTGIEAPIGGIIRVLVKDVNKINDKLYHWFQPKVLEYREDKDKPDTLEAAQLINEAATQRQSHGSAYLVNARYEGVSPLACCNAPWLAIPGENWSYLPNNAEAPAKLRELGVTNLIGTKMTHDLMDHWQGEGFTFTLQTSAIAVVDELAEPSEPSKVEIDPVELVAFLDAEKNALDYEFMKLGCGSVVPLKRLAPPPSDPYLVYPDEGKQWKYVIQFHLRGLSAHGDLRIQIGDNQLVGWTLDMGKSLLKPMLRHVKDDTLKAAGISRADLELPPVDLSAKLDTVEGKKLKVELSQKTQKLSMPQLKTLCEDLWKTEVEPILNDPLRKIYSQPKGSMSSGWLTMEGEVPAGQVGATSELEGQFIIMDTGTVEYGAQKSYFHEYWLHGKRVDGRVVVRRLPTRAEWNTKESFAWLTFFTKKGEKPYAISSRAVNQKWYPPKGVSALPKYVRIQLPAEYQYWAKPNPNVVRDELVNKRISLKLAAGLRFSVKRVWHKGPEVQRGLPVTRYWILLHDGKKVIDAWDFGLDTDPLAADGLSARRRDGKEFSDLLPTTGDIQATHPASQTSKLVNHFDTSDEGSAEIVADDNSHLQLKLNGRTLRGGYVFVKEDPGSETWIFQKTEVPETKAKMFLSRPAPRGAIQCSLAENDPDTKIEERGELLIITGPAIKPGEVLPMDGRPTYFTKEGIKKFWPSMWRQPVDILHGDLKGDVVGFVNKRWFDEVTGWGWAESVIWHPLAIKLIKEHKLPAYSIEVLPETVWDPEHQHDHVIGGRCIGLAIVPKGACATCNPVDARIGTVSDLTKPYKLGLAMKDYLMQQYYGANKSTQEIADTEGIPRSTIESWMARFEIPRRELKESRQLRKVKELGGGRPSIIALGAGKNPPCTLFTIGTDNLLINAPKNVIDMIAYKKAKPHFVLIENSSDECLAGLHQLRSFNPFVFASEEVWEHLRRNYRDITGEQGSFEDVYGFERKVLPPGRTVKLGPFMIRAAIVEPEGYGYHINMGEQLIFHCSRLSELPAAARLLSSVNIYIGDGMSLREDSEEHASMMRQIQWAKQAEVSKIYFTNSQSESPSEINLQIHDLAPNAQALLDGDEIAMGGSNPMSQLSEVVATGLMTGEVEAIIRDKPYIEYSKQAILFGHGDKVLGLYVEGYPVKMTPEEAAKLRTGLEAGELKAPLWVYKPRVLRRFDPVKEIRGGQTVGPYIYDAELANSESDD